MHETRPLVITDCEDDTTQYRRLRIVGLLGITNFFNFGIFTLTGSILPALKRDYFGGNAEASLVNSYFESSAALSCMLLLPIFGQISDSVGRKPFLYLLALGPMIPYTLYHFFPGNLYVLMSAMAVVNGLTGYQGGSPILTAVVADIAQGATRGWYISITVAFGALGLVSAPLGSLLGLTNDQIFLLALVTSIVMGLPLLLVPETLHVRYRKKFSLSVVKSPFLALEALRHPGLRFCSLVAFCSGLPEQGVINTLLFYLNDKFSFNSTNNSFLFFEVGVMMLLTTTGLYKLLSRYCTERQIVLLGLTANAIHLAAFAVAWSPYVIYAIAEPCAGLSFITFPALTSIASQQHPPKHQGMVMGVLGSMKALTSVFGPILFGGLYQVFKGAPYHFPELPFLIGTIMVILTLFASIIWLDGAPAAPVLDEDSSSLSKTQIQEVV